MKFCILWMESEFLCFFLQWFHHLRIAAGSDDSCTPVTSCIRYFSQILTSADTLPFNAEIHTATKSGVKFLKNCFVAKHNNNNRRLLSSANEFINVYTQCSTWYTFSQYLSLPLLVTLSVVVVKLPFVKCGNKINVIMVYSQVHSSFLVPQCFSFSWSIPVMYFPLLLNMFLHQFRSLPLLTSCTQLASHWDVLHAPICMSQSLLEKRKLIEYKLIFLA